ncbi:MAG: hypothetical protein F7B06_12370 [Opitutae bacterium]|nr:hypothetical protein [Opitutae bacterium]
MIETAVKWIKKLTEAGIALIALAIVVQVIFGMDVAFMPGDVIGRITSIIGDLGSHGLVGLAALAVIYVIFKR